MPDSRVREAVKEYARSLKLPTFAHAEKTIEQFKPGDSLWDFLAEMMHHECEVRQENQLRRRIHYARFPMQKTLEEFDLTRLEHVKPDYVKQLASCEFVRQHENVVLVGTPGTGKTHLMIALGMKACRYGLKVVFRNASTLATELREAKDDYHLQAMQKSLARVDLLLLDELSYAKFGQEESELLFKIIADRSERVSTMITTNLSFSQWTEMFANVTLTAALVDRLTFHSHILDMNGASYRLDSACKKRGNPSSVVA